MDFLERRIQRGTQALLSFLPENVDRVAALQASLNQNSRFDKKDQEEIEFPHRVINKIRGGFKTSDQVPRLKAGRWGFETTYKNKLYPGAIALDSQGIVE